LYLESNSVEELAGLLHLSLLKCLYMVGRCRLNQVDPYPITYSLSNP
jgi:hypothetical protein